MKTRSLGILLAALPLLGLTGCVSSSTTASPWAIIVGGGLTFGIDLATPPVLNHNPTLAPVLTAVSVAIPTAFGAGDLTPANVNATVASLGARFNLSAEAQNIIETAVNKGVASYSKAFGVSVANATNPNVVAILNGIAAGLAKGVADWQAQQGVAPSASTMSPDSAYPAYEIGFRVVGVGPDGERFVDLVPASVAVGDRDPAPAVPPASTASTGPGSAASGTKLTGASVSY